MTNELCNQVDKKRRRTNRHPTSNFYHLRTSSNLLQVHHRTCEHIYKNSSLHKPSRPENQVLNQFSASSRLRKHHPLKQGDLTSSFAWTCLGKIHPRGIQPGGVFGHLFVFFFFPQIPLLSWFPPDKCFLNKMWHHYFYAANQWLRCYF